MKRSTNNFLVDTFLILLFSAVTITGLLVWFVFPFDAGNDELSGILEGIHKWTSITLVIVSLYHFITHWKWYKNVFQNFRK